uniref:Uncharacterized protein n=1 Tax=Rhizophagus irregularis (strain DAOM 181602 / DAOM 197198 / MUCL 43194) TaxID=747089 RepID=U9UKC1_RHIID
MTIREWILNFTTLANETDETDETNETNETNEINETVDNNSIQTSQQSIIPRPLTISPELAISISTLAESAQSLVHAALSAIFNLNKPDSPKVKNAIQRIYTEIFKLFIESGATLTIMGCEIDNDDFDNTFFDPLFKKIAYEKGSINSIDDEICYKGLEDRIRECGSSVKVEKYNDIRIDTNYI